MKVNWAAPDAPHPARDASRRSMDAVSRGAKDDWLALFDPDAVVADPVGPSLFDPAGNGHQGLAAISAFWDSTISNAERIEFSISDSFAAGDEVANVGTITTYLPGDQRLDTDGVFVYRVDEQGRIRSLRAYWEFDRAMATLRPA